MNEVNLNATNDSAAEERRQWIEKWRQRLDDSDIAFNEFMLAGMTFFSIESNDWERCARCLKTHGARLVSLWGDCANNEFAVTAIFEKQGIYVGTRGYLAGPQPDGTPLFENTQFLENKRMDPQPRVGSISAIYPGAARLERHCRDLLGIEFVDAADNRRWTRHQAWNELTYPLRQMEVKSPEPPVPPDSDYPFDGVGGDAVCEIPVGPIHAGIIEPGHFRFYAVGETVLKLEERLGYVHKGIEKLAVGRNATGLIKLAARVSGDSCVAHAWAAAAALEKIAGVEVPIRAQYLRALWLERERVMNHLGDIGAICNDVAFVFAHTQFSHLREQCLRRNRKLWGHRLLMDLVVAGGVNANLNHEGCTALAADIRLLEEALDRLERILDNSQSLRGRTVTTGVLTKEQAERLGCLGYVGRASGLPFDARIDGDLEPYRHLIVTRAVQVAGDVDCRLRQRLTEIRLTLPLCRQIVSRLQELEAEPLRAPWPETIPAGEALGIVEGWRGEIATVVRVGDSGTVERFFPRDPSWFNWPALELLIDGNIVPDFPVCNKSINGSYAGVDL